MGNSYYCVGMITASICRIRRIAGPASRENPVPNERPCGTVGLDTVKKHSRYYQQIFIVLTFHKLS